MPLPGTTDVNRSDPSNSHEGLDNDVSYVLKRLEKVIFDSNAYTERNEVLTLLTSRKYEPLTDLDEVLSLDLRIAFLRLERTAFDNQSRIKLIGDVKNIADNVNVAVIDAVCKSFDFAVEQIFDSNWVNINKVALAGTKYEKLIQNENKGSGGAETNDDISADPYK